SSTVRTRTEPTAFTFASRLAPIARTEPRRPLGQDCAATADRQWREPPSCARAHRVCRVGTRPSSGRERRDEPLSRRLGVFAAASELSLEVGFGQVEEDRGDAPADDAVVLQAELLEDRPD